MTSARYAVRETKTIIREMVGKRVRNSRTSGERRRFQRIRVLTK